MWNAQARLPRAAPNPVWLDFIPLLIRLAMRGLLGVEPRSPLCRRRWHHSTFRPFPVTLAGWWHGVAGFGRHLPAATLGPRLPRTDGGARTHARDLWSPCSATELRPFPRVISPRPVQDLQGPGLIFPHRSTHSGLIRTAPGPAPGIAPLRVAPLPVRRGPTGTSPGSTSRAATLCARRSGLRPYRSFCPHHVRGTRCPAVPGATQTACAALPWACVRWRVPHPLAGLATGPPRPGGAPPGLLPPARVEAGSALGSTVR